MFTLSPVANNPVWVFPYSPNPGPLPEKMCKNMVIPESLSKCHFSLTPILDHYSPILLSGYRIIYRLQTDQLQILTVIHGSRNLAAKEVKPWDVG